MKISELMERLKWIQVDCGDLDVIMQDGDGDVWLVSGASFEEAEEDEYPDYYNMPAGYKFVKIRC